MLLKWGICASSILSASPISIGILAPPLAARVPLIFPCSHAPLQVPHRSLPFPETFSFAYVLGSCSRAFPVPRLSVPVPVRPPMFLVRSHMFPGPFFHFQGLPYAPRDPFHIAATPFPFLRFDSLLLAPRASCSPASSSVLGGGGELTTPLSPMPLLCRPCLLQIP